MTISKWTLRFYRKVSSFPLVGTTQKTLILTQQTSVRSDECLLVYLLRINKTRVSPPRLLQNPISKPLLFTLTQSLMTNPELQVRRSRVTLSKNDTWTDESYFRSKGSTGHRLSPGYWLKTGYLKFVSSPGLKVWGLRTPVYTKP